MSLACPACESRLSDDGKTLEAKGALLLALEKKSAKYDKELASLLADIAALRKQLKEKPEHESKSEKSPARPEPAPGKPEPPANLSPYARRRWREQHGG